jgi:hypothetical protein
MVNPYKGTAGTYSFYPLFSTDHVLDGAPDNHFAPGAGQFPGNRFLSQLFNGTTLYVHPLSGTFPDGSATYDGARFRPLEYKGLAGAAAFSSSYGHASDKTRAYALYSNYIFDGVTSANVFASGYGHGPRTEAEGAAASFGLFRPFDVSRLTSANVFTVGYGQPNTESDYGRNKVKEWGGVPSSQAL